MTQLTFGYSQTEDRIWFSVSEGDKFWLTRRLIIGFIAPICALLEKTVPGGDFPNALAAEQRVALEHEAALQESPDGAPALEENVETRGSGPVRAPRLVNTMTVQISDTQCTLILIANGEESQFRLSRLEFQRLLAALHRVMVSADWQAPGLPVWLSGDGA